VTRPERFSGLAVDEHRAAGAALLVDPAGERLEELRVGQSGPVEQRLAAVRPRAAVVLVAGVDVEDRLREVRRLVHGARAHPQAGLDLGEAAPGSELGIRRWHEVVILSRGHDGIMEK
jgi:hypothetical protein